MNRFLFLLIPLAFLFSEHPEHPSEHPTTKKEPKLTMADLALSIENYIQHDINLKGGKDINLDAAQAIRLKANRLEAEIDTTWTETVSGINTKTGKTINLN